LLQLQGQNIVLAKCFAALAGLKHAIERGWIILHESGTYLKFTQAGADLFA
jgi:hypothetical protein